MGDEALTWTQFVSVMGMLTAVAGIALGVAAYFFKQWLVGTFSQIKATLGEVRADIRGLNERLARLEGAFEQMKERMGRLEGARPRRARGDSAEFLASRPPPVPSP